MLFQVQDADGTWRNLDGGGTNKRGAITVEGRVGEGSYTLRVASPGGRGHLRTSPTWSVDNPPPPPPPDHDYTDAEGVQAVLKAINDVRKKHDLRPVALDTYYSQAAQEQAIDVANGADVRYIGEYLHHYDQHPEYPHDSWKSFSGCYGFSADPTTWDVETDRFLDPDFEAVMIGFTERRPGADSNPVSGRWSVSLYMFQRDHEAHTP